MASVPKPVLILTHYLNTKSSRFTNISYYVVSSSPPTTVAQMNAIANAAMAVFSPLYAAVMNSAGSYEGTDATYQDGTVDLLGSSTSAAVPGTLANIAMPDQNAVVLRKQTNLAGRANRGRWFIGGLDSSCVSNTNPNEVAAGLISSYQALVAALVSDQTFDAFLIHARHWDRKSATLVPIASGAVTSRLATTRSRRRHQVDQPV